MKIVLSVFASGRESVKEVRRSVNYRKCGYDGGPGSHPSKEKNAYRNEKDKTKNKRCGRGKQD